MNDPVLIYRLEALWNDLNVVREQLRKDTWSSEQEKPNTRAEMSIQALWNDLELNLDKQIQKKQEDLKKIEESVTKAKEDDSSALTAAWTRYAKIFNESQSILNECLVIIGTLAIRNQELDHRILYVADEVVRECYNLSYTEQRYYLLVHGLEDTVTKTRARIIRLRFPEWTIWDLPLAVHELGHIIVKESLDQEKAMDNEDDLTWLPFVQDQRDSLIAVDSDLLKKSQAGETEQAQEAEQWAESRVQEFLADAFATYTMGPAFACSSILLRLNPSFGASSGIPSDIQRAHIILSMLTWVNDKEKLPKPYSEVLELLREYWNNTVSRVNPNGKLEPTYETWLQQLAEKFGKDVGRLSFLKTALFPPNQDETGWTRARQWSSKWLQEWKKDHKFNLPMPSNEHLRDVLNATWLCRLQIDGPIEEQNWAFKELQTIGRDLCNTIMDRQGIASRPQRITASAGGT